MEGRVRKAKERNSNRLCRKNRLLDRVQINAQNFSVRLFGTDEQEIPKRDFSAGEKQIYAIAMLWALRQVSGRPLPVIIDTTLGRLDSDHRQNLVEHYFPEASHQVIVFSADTEVDTTFFEAIQPQIARTYHLNHDDEQQATSINEGYFWTAKGEKDP